MKRLKTASLLLFALALVAVPAAHAQTPELTERLPAGTVFYAYWRGADSISPASRNALVALWRDPGFAPARQLIEQGIVEAVTSNPRLAHIPPKDVQALLGRPLIFGVRLANPSPSAKAGARTHARGFLVVQASGEAAENLRAALAGTGPQAASHVRLTSAGFLVASGDPATLDDVAGRFGASPPAAESLGSLPAYREAHTELAGRPAIEFFLRIPDLAKLQPQVTPHFNTAAFLRALHLERVHLLCGDIDLNAPTALLHFSILGDTERGSLFDLFGANTSSFATLAAAPAGASFSAYRMDLGAVVSVILNAFSVALSPDQMARVKMFAGLFSTAIVPSLAGEYATIWPQQTGPSVERPALFAVTIHRQAADQLFATTLAPFAHPAGQEGEIHYFRVGPRGAAGAGQTGEKEKAKEKPKAKGAAKEPSAKALFIALTPHLLLASSDEALVRRAVHSVTAAAPPSGGLAAEPRFLAARAELPAELSGLTYLDFARIHWTQGLEKLAAAMAKNKKDPRAAERAATLEKWAHAGGGAVLARHLHWLVIGSWKNGGGVHWRGNIH